MQDMYFYEPRAGHGLRHDPMNAIVAPRPIGWISSHSATGIANLAPYSFFNLFNYRPPIIGFASAGWKDSVANIEATGEFVWNLSTLALAEAMNATSADVAGDVDEFTLAGLTSVPARLVSVARVAESPVAFECKLSQILRLQDAAGKALEAWMVLGEVIGVHIAPHLVASGTYDTVAGTPILRGGGPADYFTISEAQRFSMRRPAAR